MAHTVLNRKPLLTRIRRIKGQAEALERALEEAEDCGAILQQLAAIRGAVNGLMLEVLEGHVRDHLGAHDVPEAQRATDLELVVSVLRSYVR
jgi:DNA-binding FrmR family transcriptional regulator